VELLETQQAQLVAGLQELYKRTRDGQGWVCSPPKATSDEMPLTHHILEWLGVTKRERQTSGDGFREGFAVLQQKLVASSANLVLQKPSNDANSRRDDYHEIESFALEPPRFSNLSPLSGFHLPPSNYSPCPQRVGSIPSLKPQVCPVIPSCRSSFNWTAPVTDFDDNEDLISQIDLFIANSTMESTSFLRTQFQEQMKTGIYYLIIQ
jgi:hypothetical protein